MALRLEAFDSPAPEASQAGAPAPAPGPSADWLMGQAAGLAEGLAEGARRADAEGAALSAELARAFQAMAFSYAEARAEVLASLRPLFGLLADRLLPALAAESVGAWLAEAMAEAARLDSGRPLLVHLHPARLDAVRACLAPGAPVLLGPDPSLGPHGARLSRPGRESELDLDGCLATLREALSALSGSAPPEPTLSDPQPQARHG